ncbi:MAG: HDOD domain-containing protein [Nitrospirae bacterium]|nr:HDOD domain-containing protein [Nitrospirota bacterium]MDA1304137.1 HDOD domain-containing protein [Nitrospirota bacterium]
MPSLANPDAASLEDLLLPILEKLGRKEFDLPPLPQVATRVLALTTDPDADAAQLTALIQQDPVLASKIFQTANSAGLGASRKIESLQQAIAWLGLNNVAGSAFSLSVQSGVFNVKGYTQEVKGLWSHALATGFYAKMISGQIGQEPETAFLCGLLHGIGKPFVVHTVNQYGQKPDSPLSWDMMLQLMQESYVEVGWHLGEAWDFPVPVKEAINLHGDHAFHLANSPTKGAVITCLAKHLANHFLDPEAISEEVLRGLPVVQALGIKEEGMTALLDCRNLIEVQVQAMLI